MLDFEQLQQLKVGDITQYQIWRRDFRKAELISIAKELYGDNIPDDTFVKIETELAKIPDIMKHGVDLLAAQYLFWKAFQKTDETITLEQVGNQLEPESISKHVGKLFPPELVRTKKKTTKKKNPKPKKAAR